MNELIGNTVRTVCPNCNFSYQRPVSAEEFTAGGGPKLIRCEACNPQCLVMNVHNPELHPS